MSRHATTAALSGCSSVHASKREQERVLLGCHRQFCCFCFLVSRQILSVWRLSSFGMLRIRPGLINRNVEDQTRSD